MNIRIPVTLLLVALLNLMIFSSQAATNQGAHAEQQLSRFTHLLEKSASSPTTPEIHTELSNVIYIALAVVSLLIVTAGGILFIKKFGRGKTIARELKLIIYCAILGGIILWTGNSFGWFEETHSYGHGRNRNYYTRNNEEWMTISFVAPYLLLTAIRIIGGISTTMQKKKTKS